jgi:MoaA/NifB/PqqE/SkfB family radical SAM enzyme
MQFDPDNFCIGPFSEVRINTDGIMNFCHAADQSMTVVNENIANLTVDQYFCGHSSSAAQARKSLSQGQSLPNCHICYKNEKDGLLSFRQRRNLQAAIFQKQDFLPSVQEAWPRISSWRKPRFYHVSLSNLCNMACMMCHPRYSTMLADLHQKTGLATDDAGVLKDWTRDTEAWDGFVRHLLDNPEITCLHFMGGEPMYHKRFIELLDVLIEHKHCDFALTVVTNGSIYNPGILQRLRHFRDVQMEISIESLDSSNDYIRWPSSYKEIRKNIESYLAERDERFSVTLRSVPQLLSAVAYDQLIEFAHQNHVPIDSNVLHHPDFLCLNLLPDDIKTHVIDRLRRFIKHDGPYMRDINVRDIHDPDRALGLHAQAVIDQIQKPPRNMPGQIEKLINYCQTMDKVRHIRVIDYIPALESFFLKNGYRDID